MSLRLCGLLVIIKKPPEISSHSGLEEFNGGGGNRTHVRRYGHRDFYRLSLLFESHAIRLQQAGSGGHQPTESHLSSLGVKERPARFLRRPHPTQQAGPVRTGCIKQPVRKNNRLHLNLAPSSLTSYRGCSTCYPCPLYPRRNLSPPKYWYAHRDLNPEPTD